MNTSADRVVFLLFSTLTMSLLMLVDMVGREFHLDLMTQVTLASMAGPRQVRDRSEAAVSQIEADSCQACDSEAGALTAGH